MLLSLFVNKADCRAGAPRKKALFQPTMEAGAYARLEGRNFEFYMTKRRVVIGRNSKLGDVDVNMGSSRFISRKHLEVVLDRNSFYALCRGKNGIFVDDTFQRRENKRVLLPNSCIIRFPSTQIKIAFTSLLEDLGPPPPMHSPALPARVDSQFTSPSPFVSPMPSPTGTISAVNSCPVSPNSDFRNRVPSFDFRVMATYASRLLSSQHRQQSDTEGLGDEVGGASGNIDDGRGEKQEMNSEAMTSDLAVEEEKMEETLPQDDEGDLPGDEGEVPGDEGEVSGDSATDKAEESSQEEVDKLPSEKPHQKPPYSYAQLIVQALLASKDRKQTLSNIYGFISEKYPFFKLEDKGWKNSIRHNLSLNQYFMKAPREREGLGFGKGGYWCMHPDYEDKLTAQAYVKRKKKGIPVFPSAGLLSSRSAPPSPTHHSFMPDINLKEIETKLPMATPPNTAHFTLPQFFSQLTGVGNSSHSLPSSPSRPRAPGGFSATPLKFFPMGIPRSSSTDDIITAQKAHKPPERMMRDVITIDDNAPPPPKRVRIMDEPICEGRGDVMRDGHPTRSIQVPTLGSLPGGGGGASTGPVQFLSIPLMPTSGIPAAPPSQTLLTQPLSSFLPQNFFTVAGHAHPSQPRPDAGNSSSGGGNEG